MECILAGCKEEVAPGRMWFCESHHAEAVKWWREESGLRNDLEGACYLAKALRAMGTTVDDVIEAIGHPWLYSEEAFWFHTLHEHKDWLATGTVAVSLAREGAPQQLAGAYLVQECGCGGDDCRG